MLAMQVAFRERLSQLALPSYLDDTYICSTGTDSPESEMKMVLQAFDWVAEQLKLQKVDDNLPKSVVVLPREPQRAATAQQALLAVSAQRGEGKTPASTEAQSSSVHPWVKSIW